ncbi:hypothetical protein ACFS4T_12085 [Pseudomonas lini]
MSPEEKNWIVLNVEPIAIAFKANVLHQVEPLTTSLNQRSKKIIGKKLTVKAESPVAINR